MFTLATAFQDHLTPKYQKVEGEQMVFHFLDRPLSVLRIKASVESAFLQHQERTGIRRHCSRLKQHSAGILREGRGEGGR